MISVAANVLILCLCRVMQWRGPLKISMDCKPRNGVMLWNFHIFAKPAHDTATRSMF
jgi:hypothetical protein